MSAYSITRPALRRLAVAAAAAACAGLLTAPTAGSAPASDSRGYIDSTARCAAPSTAVVFGYTESSRVAICASPDGDLTYRGVRVRDGARLITDASRTDDGAYVAERDGIEYLVSSKSLVVSAGQTVIRDEPMLDFHRAGTGTATTPEPTGESTSKPTATPTSTTPLPPPLPAEVGGQGDGEG
ncbi:hypothetical protein CRI77_09250 [Mycolicibacterium duvalii]|uniref:Uncharacterized protein n=1 Tax=Mycolicibacterium duvalii TaxID=39688 RepID=A0A7I7JWX4_9MYCO|nr:hypothetical protein [Mycolicibacterium duvalii]MCV7369588.1 hypothetical protein [Mycolicibacterium duvalii]PEG42253.1 hypothetical protein CRI77_09250 [Mycolicibacterium duvalii]BBX16315.1 hypothetical protein MDUV_11750 [Mycolicibacterium duvalii]